MTHELMSHEPVASNIDLLSAWIESQMAYRGQPGLSIAIIRDQDIVWSKGFGHSDVALETPAAPSTIYRIASITKLFTATSIMQLRDDGKLQLNYGLLGRSINGTSYTLFVRFIHYICRW